MVKSNPMTHLLVATTLAVSAISLCSHAGEVTVAGRGAAGSTSQPQPDEARERRPSDSAPVAGASSLNRETEIDPAVFFDQLVRRYRGLHFYRDTARLVHITKRAGEEDARLETEIGCEIREGDLHVQTSASQARSALRLNLPVQRSAAAEKIARGYDLWLAPHMALRFAEEPLRDFRAGVQEGFTPTEAHEVTIDDKTMVHVELRSSDGLSESCGETAKFDLFVNPETMLVERIDGEQCLPDGGRCTTSLHITPQEAEGGAPTLMQ